MRGPTPTSLILCVAISLLSVASGGCGAAPGTSSAGTSGQGATVARVGSASITQPTLEHWMRAQNAVLAITPRSAGATPRLRVLAFLISSEQTLSEAAELHISVSDTEAQAALAHYHYNQIYGPVAPVPKEATLKKLLTDSHESRADRLWLIKLALLSSALERKHLALAEEEIPASQVSAYYRRHKGRFMIHEHRLIAAIITYTKSSVLKAKREIEAGKSIESVAAYANQQGFEGGVRDVSRRSLGPKRFEQDYFAHVKLNTLIGPLKERMYYIYEVKKITPARHQTLAEVQRKIRAELLAGARHDLLTKLLQTAKKHWHANTHCSPTYITPQCSGTL